MANVLNKLATRVHMEMQRIRRFLWAYLLVHMGIGAVLVIELGANVNWLFPGSGASMDALTVPNVVVFMGGLYCLFVVVALLVVLLFWSDKNDWPRLKSGNQRGNQVKKHEN